MRGFRTMVAVLACLGSGCIEREGRPVSPCTQAILVQSVRVDQIERVDLLFLVDNSGSMHEEQASLAVEIPRIVRILTSGDYDQDGRTDGPDDFVPVRSLNVGIITSDMGSGGFTVPTCARADFGDDGVVRGLHHFDRDGAVTPEQFADEVTRAAMIGTTGCGFEQQLEAMLKALSPAAPQPWTSEGYVAPGTAGAPRGLDRPFFRGTSPHGDGANAGFARPESVLAIIPLTDENDCSADDPEIFNSSSSAYSGTDLNLRCFVYPQALHRVERYVEGLLQLRAAPGHIVYAPIVGIPVDLAPGPGEPVDWDGLDCARDPRLCETPDPTMPNRLIPSCNVPGRGLAFPPTRLLAVGRALEARGAGVTVQSICQESYRNALDGVLRLIRNALRTDCVPRELNLRGDGTVACDVSLRMPAGIGCEGEGLSPELDEHGQPVVEGDRSVCVVQQLVPESRAPGASPPPGVGWFYDTFTGGAREQCGTDVPRIAFAGAEPPSGSEMRLECLLAVQPGRAGEVAIGTFCDPASPGPSEANPCPRAAPPAGTGALECDPVQRSCGVACTTDADCAGAGLVGFVCDGRPIGVVDPEGHAGSPAPYDFCVSPTCI